MVLSDDLSGVGERGGTGEVLELGYVSVLFDIILGCVFQVEAKKEREVEMLKLNHVETGQVTVGEWGNRHHRHRGTDLEISYAHMPVKIDKTP